MSSLDQSGAVTAWRACSERTRASIWPAKASEEALSSRPPKAGAPLPVDMAAKLSEIAGASMTAEISQNRWATLLDAVAYSPVRQSVTPVGMPAKPDRTRSMG